MLADQRLRDAQLPVTPLPVSKMSSYGRATRGSLSLWGWRVGLTALATVAVLAIAPKYLIQPPPFPNRLYMVTPTFFIALLAWLSLLLVSTLAMPGDSSGDSTSLGYLMVYGCVVSVTIGYWIIYAPIAVHWDEINHLGTSLLLQDGKSIPREVAAGYEYLDFPMLFLVQVVLLRLGVSPLATAHLLSILLTSLAYVLAFLVLRRLLRRAQLYVLVASLLFTFVNLVLAGSNYASPFLLGNVLFFTFLLVQVTCSVSTLRTPLVCLSLGIIPLTNIVVFWPLAFVLLVRLLWTRSLDSLFLTAVALAWILYKTLWFRENVLDLVKASIELLRSGGWYSTVVLLYQLEKAKVPVWAVLARYFWIPLVFATGAWYVLRASVHRRILTTIKTHASMQNRDLLALLFFVPPFASALALPLTSQSLLFERFLTLSSLPAAYFATRFLQSSGIRPLIVASSLLVWTGAFFFVQEPFLYSRIVHTWDASALRFASERSITVTAPTYALVVKKLYDRAYGNPMFQSKSLDLSETLTAYRGRVLYVSESGDVFAYWLKFKFRDLVESTSPSFSLLYNSDHVVIGAVADGGEQRR